MRLAPSVVTLAVFALLLAALWIPFGFSKTGLLEEWSLFAVLDRGGRVVGLLQLGGHETRPLVLLGWALGYWLTPNSFVGLNLVHALLVLAKGLLFYAVVYRLVPANPAFALVAALLFVVYPADTALFAFRVMNYHLTLSLYLLALWLLLVCRDRPRVLGLVGLWIALAVALGTIEVAFPLVFASPLLLIWLEGRLTRRVLWLAALWYLVPVALLIWMVSLLRGSAGACWRPNAWLSRASSWGQPFPRSVARITEACWEVGWTRSKAAPGVGPTRSSRLALPSRSASRRRC